MEIKLLIKIFLLICINLLFMVCVLWLSSDFITGSSSFGLVPDSAEEFDKKLDSIQDFFTEIEKNADIFIQKREKFYRELTFINPSWKKVYLLLAPISRHCVEKHTFRGLKHASKFIWRGIVSFLAFLDEIPINENLQ